MDPWIDQPTCYRLGREPFSSGAVALSNVVDDSVKGCHIWALSVGSVRVMYVDWRRKCICCVYQVSLIGCI
jgi:hypothetical protein